MENAREEIIADFFAQILFQGKQYRARIIEALENANGEALIGIGDEVSSEAALMELQQKEPTLLEQVIEWFKDVINRLRGLPQAKSLVEQLDNELDYLESMARKAYQSKDSKRLMKKKLDEIKFSLMNNNTFESNVDIVSTMNDADALQNKEEGNFVRVMYGTPSIVRENVEDAENLDVIISFYSLYLATRKNGVLEGHYHNLGSEIIKKLPDYINNPDAIVRTNNGRLNLFTQIETPKGNNGILSIELNTVKDINNHYGKYNLVVTVFSAGDNYTRNNIIKNAIKVEYQKEDLLQVNPQLYEWLTIVNNKSSLSNINEKELVVNSKDAKLKSLHITSAYINKKDTFSDVLVSEDPKRYVQDEHQPNVSNSVIPDFDENVNSKYGNQHMSEKQNEYNNEVLSGQYSLGSPIQQKRYGENAHQYSSKYWYPNMKKSEIDLVKRIAKREINTTENYIDNENKWLYNKFGDKTYFALYSTEDTNEPTVLYACKGERAEFEYIFLLNELRKEVNYNENIHTETGDVIKLPISNENDIGGAAIDNGNALGRRSNTGDAGLYSKNTRRRPSEALRNCLRNILKIRDRDGRGLGRRSINQNNPQFSVMSQNPQWKNKVDNEKYSEEQYNNFGWVRYNEVLTAQEYSTLLSRYADYKHNENQYPTTRFGEAVIHSSECPDVLMYVKGKIGNPQITRIIRINKKDPTEFSIIREEILSNEYKQELFPFSFIERYYGQEILIRCKARDYAPYREYERRFAERGSSEKSNTTLRAEPNGRGSAGENTRVSGADSLSESAFYINPSEYNLELTEPTEEDITPAPTAEESIAAAISNEQLDAKQRRILDFVERHFPEITLRFSGNMTKGGLWDPESKTLLLNTNQTVAGMYIEVLKHEFMHRLESKRLYQEFKQFLFNKDVTFGVWAKVQCKVHGIELTQNATAREAISKLTEYYYKSVKKDMAIAEKYREAFTMDGAQREMVADFFGEVMFNGKKYRTQAAQALANETFITMFDESEIADFEASSMAALQEIAEYKPNIFRQIVDWVKRIILKLRGTRIKADAILADELERNIKMLEDYVKQVYNSRDTKKAAENSGVEYKSISNNKITPNMDESERADIIRKTRLNVVEFTDENAELSGKEVLKLKSTYKSKAQEILKQLCEKFGVFKNYNNENIEIDFDYSRTSLRESVHKENERSANFYDFAKMLYVFDDVVANAQAIETHTDKYVETKRENRNLKQVYVLMSAFKDGDFIIPVEFNIKEFVDEVKNQLYVSVTLQKMKANLMGTSSEQSSYHIPKSTFNYSLPDIIKNVNPADKEFLKYIPDELLSKEQKTSKSEALSQEKERLDDMRYDYAVKNNPNRAKEMLDERRKEKGYEQNFDWRIEHKAPNSQDESAHSIDKLDKVYGSDIYSPQAVYYYGEGRKYDQKAVEVIQKAQNNPNSMIKIYRAVPTNIKDTRIRNGDWVAAKKGWSAVNNVDLLQKHKIWADYTKQNSVTADLVSVGLNVGGGIEWGYNNLLGDFGAESKFANAANIIRETRSEQIDWEIGNFDAFDFLYNTGMSMLDSTAAIAVGGNAGGAILGLSSAAQGTNDALNRGMSNEQAFWNGLMSGAFECIFETYSIEKLQALKASNGAGLKTMFKNLGKTMLTNASEETLTEIANIVYDTVINGDFSQAAIAIRRYMNAGLSESEAKRKVALEFGGQIAEAAGSGALMGFGFGTYGSASAAYNASQYGKYHYGFSQNSISALVVNGLVMPKGSAAHSQAVKANTKLKSGKSLSGTALYNLATAIQGEIESKSNVRLSELGIDNKTAKALSPIVAKAVFGEKLSSAERAALNNSEIAAQVVEELSADRINTVWKDAIKNSSINNSTDNNYVTKLGEVLQSNADSVVDGDIAATQHNENSKLQSNKKNNIINSVGDNFVNKEADNESVREIREKYFRKIGDDFQGGISETAETFSERTRRNSLEGSGQERLLLNEGKLIVAYTPVKDDNSQKHIFFKKLREYGIDIYYCDGVIETNVDGVTMVHNQAITTRGGKIFVSSVATVEFKSMMDHELVHWKMRMFSDSYFEYEDIVLRNLNRESNYYIAFCEELNLREYNNRYDINTIEGAIALNSEITAYVYQYVLNNSNFAENFFSKMFFDWHNVKNAVKHFNSKMEINTELFNQVGSYDESAFFAYKNKIENNTTEQGEVLQSSANDVVDNVADSTIAQQDGEVDAPEGVGDVQSDSNGAAAPGVVEDEVNNIGKKEYDKFFFKKPIKVSQKDWSKVNAARLQKYSHYSEDDIPDVDFFRIAEYNKINITYRYYIRNYDKYNFEVISKIRIKEEKNNVETTNTNVNSNGVRYRADSSGGRFAEHGQAIRSDDKLVKRGEESDKGRTVNNGDSDSRRRIDNSDIKTATSKTEVAFSMPRDYSYEALISKPDIEITEIDSFNGNINNDTRKNIVEKAVENAAAIGRKNENGNAVVYVKDIDTEIILSKSGLRHGIDRRFELLAPVLLKSGEILKNSIRINELIPRVDNISKAYVLIGVAKNIKNEPYIISFVVNKVTSEVSAVDVLYAINAKTEPAGSLSPSVPANVADYFTDSTISISKLLDYVNKYFPDILPESVLRHYGYEARPEGKIGESALFSLPIGKRRKAVKNNVIELSKNNELSKQIGDLRGAAKYKVIQQYILDVLSGEEIVLSDGKIAVVDKSDALHIANKSGYQKTAEIFAIKEIVEKALLVAEEKSTKERKFEHFYYYEATVKYDGEIFNIYLNVGRSSNDQSYHLYDITQKLRDTAHRLNGVGRPKPNEGYALETVSLNKSITKNTNVVNNNYSTETDTFDWVEELSTREKEEIESVCNELGREVVFEDLRDMYYKGEIVSPDGYIDVNGVIHINTYAKNPMDFIFKHELTHFAEDSDGYDKFAAAVKRSMLYADWIKSKTNTEYFWDAEDAYRSMVYKSESKYTSIDDSRIDREIIADFAGDVFFTKDGSGLTALTKDMDTKQRNAVIQFVLDFISYLKKKLAGQKHITFELSRLEDSYKRLLFDAIHKSQISNKAMRENKDSDISFCFVRCNDQGRLREARRMEKEGVGRREIYNKLKVFRNAFGKWSRALDLRGFKFSPKGIINHSNSEQSPSWLVKKGNSVEGILSDFVAWDELYAVYPEFKKVRTVIRSSYSKYDTVRFIPGENGGMICINKELCDAYEQKHDKSVREEIIKALQRMIQYKEGNYIGKSLEFWQQKERRGKLPYSKVLGRQMTADDMMKYFVDNYDAQLAANRELIKNIVYYVDKNSENLDDVMAYVPYVNPDLGITYKHNRTLATLREKDAETKKRVFANDYTTKKNITDEVNSDAEEAILPAEKTRIVENGDVSQKIKDFVVSKETGPTKRKRLKSSNAFKGGNSGFLENGITGDDTAHARFIKQISEISRVPLANTDAVGRRLDDSVMKKLDGSIFKNEKGQPNSLYIISHNGDDVFKQAQLGLTVGTIDFALAKHKDTDTSDVNSSNIACLECFGTMKNPFYLKGEPYELSIGEIGLQMVEDGILSRELYHRLVNGEYAKKGPGYKNAISKRLREILIKAGFDGIVYENQNYDRGSIAAVFFYEDKLIPVAKDGVLIENNGISDDSIDISEFKVRKITAEENSKRLSSYIDEWKYNLRTVRKPVDLRLRMGDAGFLEENKAIDYKAVNAYIKNNISKDLSGYDTAGHAFKRKAIKEFENCAFRNENGYILNFCRWGLKPTKIKQAVKEGMEFGTVNFALEKFFEHKERFIQPYNGIFEAFVFNCSKPLVLNLDGWNTVKVLEFLLDENIITQKYFDKMLLWRTIYSDSYESRAAHAVREQIKLLGYDCIVFSKSSGEKTAIPLYEEQVIPISQNGMLNDDCEIFEKENNRSPNRVDGEVIDPKGITIREFEKVKRIILDEPNVTRKIAHLTEYLSNSSNSILEEKDLSIGHSGDFEAGEINYLRLVSLCKKLIENAKNDFINPNDTSDRLVDDEKNVTTRSIFKDNDRKSLSFFVWNKSGRDWFKKCAIGFCVVTLESAHDEYLAAKAIHPTIQQGVYEEYKIDASNPYVMKTIPKQFTAREFADELMQTGLLTDKEYKKVMTLNGLDDTNHKSSAASYINRKLKSLGFDCVLYFNETYDPGSIGVMALDQSSLILVSVNGKKVNKISSQVDSKEDAFFKSKNDSGNFVENCQLKIVENIDDMWYNTSDIITDGSHLVDGRLKPNVKYRCGEFNYIYITDDSGRIKEVYVEELKYTQRDYRERHNPNTLGKKQGDHAGHLIADRFGGSKELDNLVSQSAFVNLSEYKKMENIWAKALDNGQKVSVDIKVQYDGDSMRPSGFVVNFTVDRKKTNKTIKN
ncbi:MAG: DNA/RNA non-specific endonuclease [Clostridia bacterium]|nr:DNA/RNA non-specific endonuclease [Clostridia bacterium]